MSKEYSRNFSAVKVEQIKQLFPQKYQELLIRVEIEPGLGLPFEITFQSCQNFNSFLRMFDRRDFPADKFPGGFSIGIMATCENCGQLNMAGGCNFDLIELNALKLKEVETKRGGDLLNVCLICLLDLIGPENMGRHIEATKRQLHLIRGGKH